jgi:type IV secretion system protein VirB9
MRKILLSAVISAVISGFVLQPALAEQHPREMSTDKRVKIIAYDPDNVVSITGSHLVATGIRFDENETIVSIVNGDPIAWTTSVNKVTPYILYIKPILPSSNTNMTVVTNKRTYQFHLITAPNDTASSKNVTYMLSFKYPDEEKAKIEQQLMALQKVFVGNFPGSPVHWNYDYSFYGSTKLAPVQAVDNGTYTVFKFRKNEPVPAIFAVDIYQNESLLNFRVQGDYVFVQGVRHQYTMRNGEDVTTVYDDSFHD